MSMPASPGSGSGVVSGGENVQSDGSSAAPLSPATVKQVENYQRLIDGTKRQIRNVRQGTHADLEGKELVLEQAMKRRKRAAEADRKHLIKNAEELYQFETEEAEATFQLELEQAKTVLLDAAEQEIRRLIALRDAVTLTAEEEAAQKVENALKSIKKGEATTAKWKRPQKRPKLGAGSGAGGGAASEGGGGGGGSSRASSGGKGSAAAAAAAAAEACMPKGISKNMLTLTDIEMRSDFQMILRDWRERALKHLQIAGNVHAIPVKVQRAGAGAGAGGEGMAADGHQLQATETAAPTYSTLEYGTDGTVFQVGDRVIIDSRITEEEFYGEITVIKPLEVFVRLLGGVKTRLHIDHLSSGRLTLRKEV